MLDLAKQFLSDPLALTLTIVTVTVYVVLALRLTTIRQFAQYYERIILFLFLLVISGVLVFPIGSLIPAFMVRGLALTKNYAAMSLIFPLGVYFCGFLLLAPQLRQLPNYLRLFLKNDRYLALLILFCPLSTLWSETPALTFIASILFIGITVISIYFANRINFSELIIFLRWSGTLIVLLSTFVSLLIPSIGIVDKGWQGITGHPNVLGQVASLNAVLWCYQLISQEKYQFRSVSSIILSAIVLIFTNSTGSLATALILILILLAFSFIRKFSPKQSTILLVFAVFIAAILIILFVYNIDMIFAAFGKDRTMTGRSNIWSLLSPAIERKSIAGYGYYGFWQFWRGAASPAAPFTAGIGINLYSAHNGFVEIALDLGLVGLALFIASLLQTITKSIILLATSNQRLATLPVIFLAYLLLTNLAESRLINMDGLGSNWVFYVWTIIWLNATLAKESKTNLRLSFLSFFH